MTLNKKNNSNTIALPEILPAHANPTIQNIYAELCNFTGAALPALIFRHLATYPNFLETAWPALSPAFQSGYIQESAWSIAHHSLPDRLLPSITPHAQTVLGLKAPDVAAIQNTLASYNRANPINLLAMLTLLELIESDGPTTKHLLCDWTVPKPIAEPIAPMTPVAQLTPDVRRLINDLGFGDRTEIDPVVPSLYRHFTHWPSVLAIFHINLIPLFKNQTIQHQTDDVLLAMHKEAKVLAKQLTPLSALSKETAALSVIKQFTSNTIPQMIVIGKGLEQAFEDDLKS